MQIDYATIIVWVTGGAVFLLVGSIWLMATIGVQMRRASGEEKLARRLDNVRRGRNEKTRTLRLWHDGKVGTTVVSGAVTKRTLLGSLNGLRTGIGWQGPLSTLIVAIMGGIAFGVVVTYGITHNAVLASGWIVAVPVVLSMLAKRSLRKESRLFEQQLADALGLATRSLRAGHPLLSAFQVIVEEMEAPVSLVFAEIMQQQALGKSLEEAIEITAEKSPSPDMKLFAASTVIQMRSGGNLADMMDRLVHVIRDRMRLQRRVRVLTAQTQLSKRVLIVIPIGLFFFLWVTKPGYIEPLYTTQIGRILLMTAGACLLAGSWVMNRIASLKY